MRSPLAVEDAGAVVVAAGHDVHLVLDRPRLHEGLDAAGDGHEDHLRPALGERVRHLGVARVPADHEAHPAEVGLEDRRLGAGSDPALDLLVGQAHLAVAPGERAVARDQDGGVVDPGPVPLVDPGHDPDLEPLREVPEERGAGARDRLGRLRVREAVADRGDPLGQAHDVGALRGRLLDEADEALAAVLRRRRAARTVVHRGEGHAARLRAERLRGTRRRATPPHPLRSSAGAARGAPARPSPARGTRPRRASSHPSGEADERVLHRPHRLARSVEPDEAREHAARRGGHVLRAVGGAEAVGLARNDRHLAGPAPVHRVVAAAGEAEAQRALGVAFRPRAGRDLLARGVGPPAVRGGDLAEGRPGAQKGDDGRDGERVLHRPSLRRIRLRELRREREGGGFGHGHVLLVQTPTRPSKDTPQRAGARSSLGGPGGPDVAGMPPVQVPRTPLKPAAAPRRRSVRLEPSKSYEDGRLQGWSGPCTLAWCARVAGPGSRRSRRGET